MKAALVSYWDSHTLQMYGYEIPLLVFGLKVDDFVVVPVKDSFTVAKVKLIVTRKEFFKINPTIKLKKIKSKIHL
ncbi:MAG: hypothetical protein PHG81_12875 [Aliarcobacter sp.]|nr:hypothetical protein [Aliarcobacter sp.]